MLLLLLLLLLLEDVLLLADVDSCAVAEASAGLVAEVVDEGFDLPDVARPMGQEGRLFNVWFDLDLLVEGADVDGCEDWESRGGMVGLGNRSSE